MNTIQEQSTVSIIVPIYNASKYLRCCLESIFVQTYSNIEIILINDGSTDDSLEICSYYALTDSRFKILDKENEGVSIARNKGLELASGDYVSFIDSDDYVDKTFIEKLLKIALNNSSDIAVCSYIKTASFSASTAKSRAISYKDYTPIEAVKDVLNYNTELGVVLWNKIYKKSIFTNNNISFPAGKIMEDSARIHEIMFSANKIVYTNEQLYYYIQRKSGNITSSSFGDRLDDVLGVINDQKMFLKKNNLNLQAEMTASELTTKLGMINTLIDQGDVIDSNWKILRSSIIENNTKYLADPLVHPRQKISIIILTLGESVYKPYRKCFAISKKIHLILNKKKTI